MVKQKKTWHIKAFTTLWFWRSEIVGKFQIVCQKQSNVNAPKVCYTHTSNTRTAIGVLKHNWQLLVWRFVIHIGVGLIRCSFRQTGQFLRASDREASNSTRLHAFLCHITNRIIVTDSYRSLWLSHSMKVKRWKSKEKPQKWLYSFYVCCSAQF